MNRRFLMVISAFILAIAITVFPTGTAFAEIADGTYKIDYEMKERSSENTSIADGFFTKPATLTVEDGDKYIKITVTGADMIESLGAPTGPVEILDEDEENDERTVKFEVEQDLSEPLMMDMHVIVPDLYDTEHQARAVFDMDSMEEIDAGESDDSSSEEAGTEAASDTDDDVDNPQTGDSSSIGIYVALLLASIGFFTIYKLRTARD